MAFLVAVFKPLAYLSLPVILLRSISASSSTGRYYVRQTLYVGTLMTVAACSIVFAAGLSIVGRKFDVNYVVAKTFYFLAHNLLDVRIEVEGQEHLDSRPGVLMANHQTMLDILVVGRLMPKQTSIMAKKSLQFTPLGPFMTMSGAIFVDRGNNTRAIRSLAAAGELMRTRRISLWMFPEGTRTSTEIPDIRPLKKGGFHLAIQSGLPIIPIVTENYWRMYHKGVFDTGVIKVRVLPPIPTAGLTTEDISELTTRVRDEMLKALREISVVPAAARKALLESEEEKEKIATTSGISEVDPKTSAEKTDASVRVDSPAASLVSLASENSSAATEEDDGMILVGKSTHSR